MKWLIDGHNLIGQMPGLGLHDPHDEDKLLEHLRRFRAKTGHSLVVIFDPGQVYHPAETKKRGGITIQFAAHGQSADRLIIRRLRRVTNPQEFMVVSSDRAIQQAARQAGVRVMSSQEFARQLLSAPAKAEAAEDTGSRADVQLSADEIEAWLALFKRSKP